MKLLSLLLLHTLAVAAIAAPCFKPIRADIVWLVDSTALAQNELQAVAGLIQAVGEDLHLAPEGDVRMGYVDAAARLKVSLVDVVDYGKQFPEMRDAAAALEAVEKAIFAKSRPGITRILILLSMDSRVEAAARSLKTNQDVLIVLLHAGGAAPPRQDFVDFVFQAANFDELATNEFRSRFLCLDLASHSNSTFPQARSLAMVPNRRFAAGAHHFNYIQSNGQVFSWGRMYGLGAGDILDSTFPRQMLGVSAASDVSAGVLHTCVVDGGAAKCCGQGTYGVLGNGATSNLYTVVQVQNLSANVAQIVAGGYHSCAILDGGGIKCWGRNDFGQLGNGGNDASNVPVSVTNYSSSGVHSACGGYLHTCIVTTGGAALCAGYGTYGQLGNGENSMQYTMTQVKNLTIGVIQISCGEHHTCALLSTGALACFGANNVGQLGMGTPSLEL